MKHRIRPQQRNRGLARLEPPHLVLQRVQALAGDVHQRSVIRHVVLCAAVSERVGHIGYPRHRRRRDRERVEVVAHHVQRPVAHEADVAVEVARIEPALLQDVDLARVQFPDLAPRLGKIARDARQIQQRLTAGKNLRPAMRVGRAAGSSLGGQLRDRLRLAAVFRNAHDRMTGPGRVVDISVFGPVAAATGIGRIGQDDRLSAVDRDLFQLAVAEEGDPLLVR